MCTLGPLFHSIQKNFAKNKNKKVDGGAIVTDWKFNHIFFSINAVYNQTSISSKPLCPLANFNSSSSYTVRSWAVGEGGCQMISEPILTKARENCHVMTENMKRAKGLHFLFSVVFPFSSLVLSQHTHLPSYSSSPLSSSIKRTL